MSRRGRSAPAAACLLAALAGPPLRARANEGTPIATGLEATALTSDGAEVTVRLERLASGDWTWGPLAIRPFARATVAGGRITVRRPRAADATRVPAAPAARDAGAQTPILATLHRLAEGLAGRELVELRVRELAFVAMRGGDTQLEIEAEEARVEREEEALRLRGVRARTPGGQRLEAGRARLRWGPERLEIRGGYRLCDAERCARGRGAMLAFDPASGRLAVVSGPAAAATLPAAGQPAQGEQRRQP